MSDTDVLAMLDRAADYAPRLHLTREAVIARGTQIVRRRRAAGAGMALGALVLAGGLWSALGGDAWLGALQEVPAASTQTLGLDTELVTTDGTVFAVTAEGQDVLATGDGQTYPTTVHPDGGPVMTLLGDGRPVLIVPGWDPSSANAARVGPPVEGDIRWIRPVDTAAVRLDDGTPVVLLTVPSDELGGTPEVFGEEQPDGTVLEVAVGGADWSVDCELSRAPRPECETGRPLGTP